MRLLDRVILRCEGNIPQLAPSSQLSWKTLHSVMLGAIESLECLLFKVLTELQGTKKCLLRLED